MNQTEIERLAILETQVSNIYLAVEKTGTDVASLDAKIDTILINMAKGSGALVLVNRAIPVIVSVVAVVIATITL